MRRPVQRKLHSTVWDILPVRCHEKYNTILSCDSGHCCQHLAVSAPLTNFTISKWSHLRSNVHSSFILDKWLCFCTTVMKVTTCFRHCRFNSFVCVALEFMWGFNVSTIYSLWIVWIFICPSGETNLVQPRFTQAAISSRNCQSKRGP